MMSAEQPPQASENRSTSSATGDTGVPAEAGQSRLQLNQGTALGKHLTITIDPAAKPSVAKWSRTKRSKAGRLRKDPPLSPVRNPEASDAAPGVTADTAAGAIPTEPASVSASDAPAEPVVDDTVAPVSGEAEAAVRDHSSSDIPPPWTGPGRSNRPQLPRNRFFYDHLDKLLFIGFTVCGFAVLFLLKRFGMPAWLGAVGAVSALFVYAGLAWRIDVFRLHPDRLGDNCYYMGFLFTLASLSAALVSLEAASANLHEKLIDQLIGSFGIALFSTITGIFLRVLFMQMHREVEDLEEQIRAELQTAAMHLKDQLGYAVAELEVFRARTQQVMRDRLDEAVAGLAGTVSGALGKMDQATRQHADAITRLEEGVGRAGASVEALSRQVAAIDLPADILTRPMAAAAHQITAVANSFASAAQADEVRQSAAASALDSIDRAVQRLSDGALLARVSGAAGALSESLLAAAEGTRGFVSSLDSQTRAIAALGQDALIERGRASEAREAVEADVTRSRDALAKLQETLVDITEAIALRLGGDGTSDR